jgi:hypothetical protein
MRLRSLSIALFVLALTPTVALAQPSDRPAADAETGSQATTSPDPAQVEELRRRVDVLAAEVEKLRSGEPATVEVTEEQRRSLGLSPSAAATYRRATEGVSFAGYGEMLLERFADETQSASDRSETRLDFLRAILYTGYRFNDRFLFNSEIEVEHGGEIGLEFAYIDYMVRRNLTLRGGMMLIPLGLVNEFHEPTVFIGARRPETERRILPSTWHENGVGLLGSAGLVSFRAYVVNGFNAMNFSSGGVRDGRQGGAEAEANDFAFAGRVDITPFSGVFAGVGLYNGGAGQNDVVLNGERLDVGTTIWEVHGQGQVRGFDVRALFARASIDHARELTLARRTLEPRSAPVADTMQGGYLQVAYNVLSQFNTPVALNPYIRYEQVDTQH